MRLLVVAIAIATLTACGAGRPVQQTTFSETYTQQAVVMAPELPVGFGKNLAPGMSSLSAVAGLTGAQAPSEGVGQQAIPIHGVLRGASGIADGIELTASGSFGSPDIDPGPAAVAIEDPSGILGRGTIGVRAFVPTKSEAEVGFAFDAGAEASTYKVQRTTTATFRDRSSSTSDVRREPAAVDLRVKPHFRTAMVLRVPLGNLPVTAIGGTQVQNWTVYWDQATRTETCTTYRHGSTECEVSGNIPKKPSKQVLVLTPTAGVSVNTDVATLHLQGFVHVGPTAVDDVPWGGMVSVELFELGRTREIDSLATY